MQTERLSCPRTRGTCCLKLTDTFAWLSGETGAVVALQPPPTVAGKPVAAGLAQLPGTHRAAPAAIRHQGDPWWALRGSGGAQTGAVTQLGTNLTGTHTHTGARYRKKTAWNQWNIYST